MCIQPMIWRSSILSQKLCVLKMKQSLFGIINECQWAGPISFSVPHSLAKIFGAQDEPDAAVSSPPPATHVLQVPRVLGSGSF